jgi:hypothetical protein
MNRDNCLKQKVLQLVDDFKSDSKSKSSKAEKELIKICEPIIKRFYNIASKFGKPNEHFGFPYDYRASRGGIDSFVGVENMKLEFYYTDGCMGELYEAYPEMPLNWLDEGSEEEFFKFCKRYTLRVKSLEIEKLKKDYIIKYNSLKNKFKEIEIMEYSKE